MKGTDTLVTVSTACCVDSTREDGVKEAFQGRDCLLEPNQLTVRRAGMKTWRQQCVCQVCGPGVVLNDWGMSARGSEIEEVRSAASFSLATFTKTP